MSKQQVAKVYEKWAEIYESVKGTSQSFINFAAVRGVNVYDAEHYKIFQQNTKSITAKYPYKYH